MRLSKSSLRTTFLTIAAMNKGKGRHSVQPHLPVATEVLLKLTDIFALETQKLTQNTLAQKDASLWPKALQERLETIPQEPQNRLSEAEFHCESKKARRLIAMEMAAYYILRPHKVMPDFSTSAAMKMSLIDQSKGTGQFLSWAMDHVADSVQDDCLRAKKTPC